MRPAPALAAGLVLVLVLGAGCGAPLRPAPAAAGSPAAATAGAQAVTPSPPMPSPPPGTRLSVTGALNAMVSGATAAGHCGRSPNGFGVDLRFQVSGRPYSLSIALLAYAGPGTYQLPPNRVSLHTLGIGPDTQFYGSTGGAVAVGSGERAGTIDASLEGDTGRVHLSGTWSCTS